MPSLLEQAEMELEKAKRQAIEDIPKKLQEELNKKFGPAPAPPFPPPAPVVADNSGAMYGILIAAAVVVGFFAFSGRRKPKEG